ncbi:MAG: S-layer homology domain-containing protein [candidate division SR1 bacterium]|nr:S-layer homology domain-containing protein [candidate division SR1 bacterium]
MKNVHKHITSLGDFYMRHRRMFVMVKVVILAGIMTFAFSIQNDNGKIVYHGAASTYADSLCGNGKCDNNTAYCSLSYTDCTKINTGSCAGITGCSVDSKSVSTCAGTIFSCSAIIDSTVCSDVGCNRKNNTCNVPLDSKGNPISETCDSRSAAQCTVLKNKNIGTCSPSVITTESCIGTISTPKNENDCINLNNTPFAPTTKRYPEYIENQSSCAIDCTSSIAACMGNGAEVFGKGSCEELTINYPETSCAMYHSSSYQCAYDSKNNKCMDGVSCKATPTQICGNGKEEGTEVCDNGVNNSDTNRGACKTDCKSRVIPPTCTGTHVSTMFCSDIATANPKTDCANYYNMMNQQCTYDSANNKCMNSTSCMVPAIPTPINIGLSTTICSGVTEIPESECVQLINLYNSTSGSNWTNSNNRGNTGNICRNGGSKGFDYSGAYYTGNMSGRYGIMCIDNHVAGLAFKDNNLVGNFDVDFYQLPNLVGLAIPGNTGLETISPSISGAQSLTILKLDGGMGEFPAGIAYLQNLEYIRVDNFGVDDMRYIPGLFPKLKGISLVGNHLITVSGALATLRPNLEYVDLSNNCIDTSTLSASLISFINDKQAETNPDRASQQNNCKITVTCGNGIMEGTENCDNGSNNGHLGYCNATCNGYTPSETCGNYACESRGGNCWSNFGCTQLNTGSCSTVPGCTIAPTNVYACTGTTFSCSTIKDQGSCQSIGCDRNKDNLKCSDSDSKGNTVSQQTCSTLSEQQCSAAKKYSIGDCSQAVVGTKDICEGGLLLPNNQSDCDALNKIVTKLGYIVGRTPGYSEDVNTCTQDCGSVCGNGVKDGTEYCDNGIKNSDTQPGACNTKCTSYTPITLSCGNNIIEGGEACDDGMNNGKPGQCNKTCNGRETLNLFCGDGMCRSSCSLTGSLTCANLNSINGGKDLCTALGCSLQYLDNSNCEGTVSCSDITPEKFWGSLEGAEKYCSIAGCGWDKTKSVCTLPKDNKTPSCGNIGVSLGLTNTTEYCPRLPGCNLFKNNKTPNTICVGGILPRADKLNQTQCKTLEGTRNTEDVASCNVDCKGICSGSPTDNKKCNELSVAECTNTYALGEGVNGINCVVQEEKGKQICTNGQYACTTCGNKICDGNESENSCPSDCLGEVDWPKILYSSSAPKDGSLITGKVDVSVYLPPHKNCQIINNDKERSYSFKYNGYYIFQVNCPWFDKPWDLVAKVYWLQGDTIGAINTKDIASGTSGSNIYYENKANLMTDVTTNTTMATTTKKYIYEQALNTSASPSTTAPQVSKEIVLSKNISFFNDPKVYQKVLLEGNLTNATATQATLTIPADVTIKSETNGTQTDFKGVLVAPTTVTGSILNAFSSSSGVENVDTVIKVGDQNNSKLVAVDGSGTTTEFSLTIETKAQVGSTIQVYSSQDGKTRTYYGEGIVKTDGIINYIIVSVPHLTYYGITTPTSEENPEGGQEEPGTNNGGNTNLGGGGGGGYSALIKDICPAQRDCSSGYYDHLCGSCPTTGTEIHPSANPYCPKYSRELNQAYSFAFDNSITTIDDCDKVNLDGQLLRSHMAKMISNFAITTLGLKPNTGTVCNFTDMSKESDEMKFYSKIACQLGLMGMNDQGIINGTFNPNETVTRAQFGTVLSRLIRQNENNGGVPYYTKHLQALKTAGIMTKIDEPNAKELRGFVMVMLQRVTSQVSPTENGSKTLRELVKDFFRKK